jgi:hypothetical protein
MPKEITPFDFMNAASFSKDDIISNNDNPEIAENLYSAYIVNRGFTNFEDTILHANEMNQRHELFPGAQFDYYRAVLRKRKRFSKWPKATKDVDLDAIQEVYQCNRTVAKQYFKVLNKEQLQSVHDRLITGG